MLIKPHLTFNVSVFPEQLRCEVLTRAADHVAPHHLLAEPEHDLDVSAHVHENVLQLEVPVDDPAS